MDVALLLNVVTTLSVVGGVVFAAWQIRVAAQARKTETTLQVMQMLHSRDLTEGVLALMDVPAGLTLAELRQRLGERWSLALHGSFMLDGLGLLVYRGEISAEVADDFFKNAVATAWDRWKAPVIDLRREENDTVLEWLQWLAESQVARGTLKKVPVYKRV